ncbi:glycosyltransferase [Leptolyngbya sp. FACHB-261]|uniref:glycosyltransferase family 2 protein n=1 Tax=Leptolyngbya sp. FACHB-261 TaxID=2692806 RepID=UPI0016892961|nr:glycosyltransferase [Leptolyngbya sp. FACHB-261]MBD2101123.1 glycosyltransferase [Leptolyngbya sp. FACHB-261]
MQQPLISVIIPTYNRLAYLKEALKSVLRQTYQNFEVIVSDDCSPESPQALIEDLNDPRIRLRRNSKNLGVALNVAHAFEQAQGEYIACLNDDDLWNENFLEKLVLPLVQQPELALAFCDHYIIDANGNVDQQETEQNSKRWYRNQLKEGIYQPFYDLGLVHQAVSPASSAVIRREMINLLELREVGVYWDYYLTYLACRSGRGAYYCPERLTLYRIHPQSETMTSGSRNAQAKIRKANSGIFCYERFMEDTRLREFRPYFQKKWAHANTTLGIALLRTGEIERARFYLWRAMRGDFSLRSCAAMALSLTSQALTRQITGIPQ